MSDVIPLYMVQLQRPSDVQIGIEKLEKFKKGVESKKKQAFQPTEPTLSQAGQWADDLIVSPTEPTQIGTLSQSHPTQNQVSL